MKIKILSTNLNKCLSKLSHALPNNPLVPALENFLFDFSHDSLNITATDLQTTLSSKVSLLEIDNDIEQFSIAIPAKILYETIKSLPEQILEIYIDKETFAFSINSLNGTYKLIGENSYDFPVTSLDQQTTASRMELESTLLKQIFSTLLITMSKDEVKPSLNGLCIDICGENMNFVSTDTFKLCKYELTNVFCSKFESSIVLSRKSVIILLSIMQNEGYVNFNLSDEFFYGAVDGCNFICRLVNENFPRYDNVIPVENDKILQINRLELLKSLKRIAIFANKSTRYVSFSLSMGSLTVTAEDLDFSNAASEILICDYADDDLVIGFNINSLIEIISVLKSEEIKIKFSASNKACLIIPILETDLNENIVVLLMPVLLNVNR